VHQDSPPPSVRNATGIWNQVVDLLERASRQRHIVALRDGMIGAVPVILVGSTFLLLGVQGGIMKEYFPNLAASSVGQSYLEMAPTILLPFRYTMGLLSLYVSFTIAAALAKQYDLPQIPNGLTAVATFLVAGDLLTGAIYVPGQPFNPDDAMVARYVAAKPLGAEGLFLAIIVGLLTVEISRHLTFLPKDKDSASTAGVPPAVIHAFASFLPMLVCVFLMFCLRHWIGVDIHHFISEQTAWLKALGDSYSAVFGVNVLLHLFGVAGVHGISVINAAMLPIWQEFVVANADAHEAGKALPYVTAYPFYQWFIWIGGAGATLAPTIRCMRSKNAHVKKIGKVALIPGLFNVNEPLLFGLPVVANPILGIPFIVAPLVCGTIAYYATVTGLVGRAFIEVPWVMPCFLGAVLSTQDKMAIVLLTVNLAVSYVIWAPFISQYEKRLESDAQQELCQASDPTEGESPPDGPN
jgi:cellobiose PTS system EIIC component